MNADKEFRSEVDKLEPTIVPEIDKVEPAPPNDPLDLSRLRLNLDFIASAGVRKLITTIPCRRPGKQEFVRVHPNSSFRAPFGMIRLRDGADQDCYLVDPEIIGAVLDEVEFGILHAAMSRQGVLFLWFVRVPGPDGRPNNWWKSDAEAVELAQRKFVRVRANMSLGAYESSEATGNYPEPVWPELDFQAMIDIAFKDKVIADFNHPALQRLRGA